MKRTYTEEQKEKRKEYYKKWYQKNKKDFLEKNKEYRKKYKEENREKILEYNKKYYQDNKDKKSEYFQDNKLKRTEYQRQYNKTPYGRAYALQRSYRHNDEKYNRGECTITAQWIIENIFTSKCYYCGKTDWHELGCDRIDNSKPHTPDNVVCCCKDCNSKRGKKEFEEYLMEIDMTH